MSTAQTLISADEFFRMPQPADGSEQELIRGVIFTMPPPGGTHGACCSRLNRRLAGHVEDQELGTVFCNDTGFVVERDPDTVKGPDLSFYSKERLPEIPNEHIAIAPDLAVEVVSPHDHFSRVQQSKSQYLKHGVRMVWIIDPQDCSATVYRQGKREALHLTENDVLSGEDVVPGFECRVGDLFA